MHLSKSFVAILLTSLSAASELKARQAEYEPSPQHKTPFNERDAIRRKPLEY